MDFNLSIYYDTNTMKFEFGRSKPASSVCFDSTKAARRSTTKAAENFLTTTTWSILKKYIESPGQLNHYKHDF